jgi:hypothetical protein
MSQPTINHDGSINTASKYQQVVFQAARTVVGVGSPLIVGSNKTLCVEIFGVLPVGATISFQAASLSGVYSTIQGYNESTATTAATATVTAAPILWTIDITGKTSIVMNLTAITSGSVTVQGTVIA